MRSVSLGFLFFPLILALSACHSGGKPGVHLHPSPGFSDLEYVGSGWSPEQIEIECAAKQGCPQQVGLLIFVFPEQDGKIPFSKCTAFLNAANQITSNGHCDRTGTDAKGYFVMMGPEKQVRQITRTVIKLHTPGERRSRESGRPDVALYELNEPIRTVAPLTFAGLKDPQYDKLIGFVINNGRDASHYSVDQVTCQVRRHEALFPYDLKENPDVVTAFQCGTNRGNSGGPAFAPGLASVQGVLQATSGRERKRQVVREKLNRELYAHEQHDTVTITNLRCMGAPSGACVAVDLGQTQTRFSAMQTRAVQKMSQRGAPASASGGVRYQAIAFQTINVAELKFEVFHQPVCVEAGEKPKKITAPLEFMDLAFNEWGELNPRVLETRMAYLNLKSGGGPRFEVTAEWPESFAPLVNSEQHPRRIWGRAFSVDLPPCPR